MHCEELNTLLGRWYDDELSESEARVVSRHMEGCTSCTAELDAWRRIDSLLGADLHSPDLESGVMTAIRSHSEGAARWWMGIAAAALISAGLGVLGAQVAQPEVQEPAAENPRPSSLAALENSFGPGALAGIDDIAEDLLQLSRRRP